MVRRKMKFAEADKMSDSAALKHSRTKYDRTAPENDRDEADTSTMNFYKEDEKKGFSDDLQSKHTLDSDEEDEDKYERLDVNRVEGQENATLDFEGNTKITPFNMRDELEDGHFDTTGNFIFKKDEEQIKDAWLDNIDWSMARKKAGDRWQQQQQHEEEQDDNENHFNDAQRNDIYEKLLQILKPNETIAKAMLRVADQGEKLSIAEQRKRRWALKKAGKLPTVDSDNRADQVEIITELADKLVSDGDLEAYQLTYEKLNVLLKKPATNKPVDQNVDIFDSTPTVEWEYKWTEDNDGPIVGPFSTEDMAKKQQGDFFEQAAWARKIGVKDAPFYPIKRIDFDLYM